MGVNVIVYQCITCELNISLSIGSVGMPAVTVTEYIYIYMIWALTIASHLAAYLRWCQNSSEIRTIVYIITYQAQEAMLSEIFSSQVYTLIHITAWLIASFLTNNGLY